MTQDAVTDETRKAALLEIESKLKAGFYNHYGAAEPEPGIYKVIEAHELEAYTSGGWQFVRTITAQQIVVDREDAVAPAHGQYSHQTPIRVSDEPSHDRYGQRNELHIIGTDDPRLVTIVRTSHVPKTLFLLRMDEAYALKKLANQLEKAQSEERQGRFDKRNLEVKFEAEQKAATEARQALARAQANATHQANRCEEQIERSRKMEKDLGALRKDYNKLAAALGDIKVKDILGNKV